MFISLFSDYSLINHIRYTIISISSIAKINFLEIIFSELLFKWRENIGLTQQELSEKIGYHRRTINQWERGKTIPYDSTIRRISEKLGIEYQDFLKGPNQKITKKVEKEEFPIIDARMFSFVYAFSGIRESWESSHLLGVRVGAMGPSPARKYRFVYIDTTIYSNIGIPFGSEIIFLEDPAKISEDDLVLAFEIKAKKPRILLRKDLSEDMLDMGKKLKLIRRE